MIAVVALLCNSVITFETLQRHNSITQNTTTQHTLRPMAVKETGIDFSNAARAKGSFERIKNGNVTSFPEPMPPVTRNAFRVPLQLEYFKEHILPNCAKNKEINISCIGPGEGGEVASILTAIVEYYRELYDNSFKDRLKETKIRVLAIDINGKCLGLTSNVIKTKNIMLAFPNLFTKRRILTALETLREINCVEISGSVGDIAIPETIDRSAAQFLQESDAIFCNYVLVYVHTRQLREEKENFLNDAVDFLLACDVPIFTNNDSYFKFTTERTARPIIDLSKKDRKWGAEEYVVLPSSKDRGQARLNAAAEQRFTRLIEVAA